MHRVRINVGESMPAAALISNAFARASARATRTASASPAALFGRIAQAGRTAMRLDTLEARNGY